jgi:integrase
VAKSMRRTRGDGALYQRADGMWCASVELPASPDGRRRRKVVTSRTQTGALAKLRQVRRDVEEHGSVPTASITVSAWLAYWLREVCAPRVKPRTVDGYRHKVSLIDAAIGRVRLDKLTAAHVRQVHAHARADGRSPTTALHCHRVLRKALKDAQREGVVLRNVADLVDAPAAARVESATLTAEQAQLLLRAAVADPLVGRWVLALFLGVRQGEALGLTWDCVDFETGTIDLAWQLQRLTWRHGCGSPATCGRRRGVACPQAHHGIPAGMEARHLEGAWFLTRPKRGSARVVPLLPFVEATLRNRADVADGEPNPYGLVFTRADGRPIDPSLDNRAWHEWLEAAGLPSVKLHSARHTTATLLLGLGVPEDVRMQILGHSVATTHRAYAHVDLEQQRRALAALEGAIAP